MPREPNLVTRWPRPTGQGSPAVGSVMGLEGGGAAMLVTIELFVTFVWAARVSVKTSMSEGGGGGGWTVVGATEGLFATEGLPLTVGFGVSGPKICSSLASALPLEEGAPPLDDAAPDEAAPPPLEEAAGAAAEPPEVPDDAMPGWDLAPPPPLIAPGDEGAGT